MFEIHNQPLWYISNHTNISNKHQLIIAVIRSWVNYLVYHSTAYRINAESLAAIYKRDKYLFKASREHKEGNK